MASCEWCWHHSEPYNRPDSYYATMRQAESEGWPCTKNDENGARLRAGDYWDEATKRDTRNDPQPIPERPE
jgi:hypothetical protein